MAATRPELVINRIGLIKFVPGLRNSLGHDKR
jgi:hypothetical protein